MSKRYIIKTEIVVDDKDYFDYVESQVNDFIKNNGYITSSVTKYEEIEITEREKFANSPFYQESIINNSYFTTNTDIKLNKEFELLKGKEVTDKHNENKSFGKLLDIIADKNDYYYVTEKGWISCVCSIKEFIPSLILPIGIAGSGKSTWSNTINKNNDYVIISLDNLRIEFTGDINNKTKDKEIYQEAILRTIEVLKQNKNVIFDSTNLTKEKRLPIIETVRKKLPDVLIKYKLFQVDSSLAKQKIQNDIQNGVNRASVSHSSIDRHFESYKQMLEDIKKESIIIMD